MVEEEAAVRVGHSTTVGRGGFQTVVVVRGILDGSSRDNNDGRGGGVTAELEH